MTKLGWLLHFCKVSRERSPLADPPTSPSADSLSDVSQSRISGNSIVSTYGRSSMTSHSSEKQEAGTTLLLNVLKRDPCVCNLALKLRTVPRETPHKSAITQSRCTWQWLVCRSKHMVHVCEQVTNKLMASLVKYMELPPSECGRIHSRNPCSRQCHGLFYDCLPAQEQRHGLTPSLRSHATFEPSRRAKCDTAATILLLLYLPATTIPCLLLYPCFAAATVATLSRRRAIWLLAHQTRQERMGTLQRDARPSAATNP